MRGISSPVLVGRSRESARLEELLGRALAGEPNLVLVRGEAGIGKTRLLREHVAVARSAGVRVLEGACVPVAERGLPLAPLVDALRELGRTEPEGELARLLGRSRRELARLVPSLLADGETALPGEAHPNHLLQVTGDALVSLATDRPVLLAIEDLHWADDSTLDLMAFLSRSLRHVPVQVLSTCRAGAPERPGLRAGLAELSRCANVATIDVPPLDRDEVGRLVGHLVDGPPPSRLVELVVDRADGNPFLVEELVAFGSTSGARAVPPLVCDVLSVRLEPLSAAGRRLVEVAATIGRAAPYELLRRVAGLSADDLRRELRATVDRQILVPGDDGTYRFRHALLREIVHGELLPEERVALHREIAEAIAIEPGAVTVARSAAAELAYHWSEAGEPLRAYEAAVEAGLLALELPAFPEANDLLRRALELRSVLEPEPTEPPRWSLLRWAAGAADGAGDVARAVELQRAAIAAQSEDVTPEDRATALIDLAMLLWQLGRTEEYLQLSQEAEDLLTDRPPSAARVAVRSRYVRLRSIRGMWEGMEPLARATVAEAELVCPGTVELAAALDVLGQVVSQAGDGAEAIALLRRAIDVGRAAGGGRETVVAYNNHHVMHVSHGTLESCDAALDGAVAYVLERPYRYPINAYVLSNAAEVWVRDGRLREAAELLDVVGRFELGAVLAAAFRRTQVSLAFERGDADGLERTLATLVADGVREEDEVLGPVLLEARARLALLRRDVGAVSRAIDALLTVPWNPVAAVQVPLSGLLTRVWVRDGATMGHDGPALLSLLTAGVARVESGQDRFLNCDSHVADVRLLLPLAGALVESEHGAALDRWREVVGRAERRSLRLLGQIGSVRGLAMTSDPAATELARATLAEIDERELGFHRGLLLDLARRARLDVAAPELEHDERVLLGLTRREREVLGLVAIGRTNREIGEELFISVKTASVHVSNILAKLGVANRVEAAAAAHRHGLLDLGA